MTVRLVVRVIEKMILTCKILSRKFIISVDKSMIYGSSSLEIICKLYEKYLLIYISYNSSRIPSLVPLSRWK